MRFIVFARCVILLALALTLNAAEPLTNATVIRMVQAGVPADLVLKTVRDANTFQFGMLPGDLIQLEQAKVPNEVIRAMAAKVNTPPDASSSGSSASERPTASFQASVAAPLNPPTPLAANTSVPDSGRTTPIPAGITVCLQPMVGGFDEFVMGEMRKQQVPVTIIAALSNLADPSRPEACDPRTSFYTMTGSVVPEGKSFSARSVFGLRVHFRDEVQAAVKLVRNSDNAVVWAGDSDRGEAKKVAEHIVNQMLKQRPIWIPSPINR